MDTDSVDNVCYLRPRKKQIADESLSLIYAGMDMFETLKPDPAAIFITHAFYGIL